MMMIMNAILVSSGHGLHDCKWSLYPPLDVQAWSLNGRREHIGGWVDFIVLLAMFCGRSWYVVKAEDSDEWSFEFRYPAVRP